MDPERKKLLSDMMADDAKDGLYEQRKPLLDDGDLELLILRTNDLEGLQFVRDTYENLITEGKLRVVEEVEMALPIHGAKYGWDWYCRGCGNGGTIKPDPSPQKESKAVNFCPFCGGKIKRA